MHAFHLVQNLALSHFSTGTATPPRRAWEPPKRHSVHAQAGGRRGSSELPEQSTKNSPHAVSGKAAEKSEEGLRRSAAESDSASETSLRDDVAQGRRRAARPRQPRDGRDASSGDGKDSDRGYVSSDGGEDRIVNSWPSFPRMSAEDERQASSPGHFTRRLQDAGLLDVDRRVTELGQMWVEPMEARYVHLIINKMLSMNRRYQTVLAVIRDVGEHMGPVNVATAMHRLGKLVRTAKTWDATIPERTLGRPQYRLLLRRAKELADEIQPRAVANFLWGMAALGDNTNAAVVRRLGQRLMVVDPAELKTQELSNVVWSMVRLEVQMPELVDRMLDSAADRIDDCVPQALSNMVWACASMKHHHPRFMTACTASAAPRIRDFQSQTLANILWAHSVLGLYPPELFNAAADEVVSRFKCSSSMSKQSSSGGTGEEVASGSDSDESAATEDADAPHRGSRSGTAATAAAGRAPSSARNSKQKDRGGDDSLSSSDERAQAAALARPWGDSTDTFQGQEISNILIAYARGCIIHKGLLQVLEEALCEPAWAGGSGRQAQQVRVDEFTCQALANSLWAFASLRWYPARLLPVITEALGRVVHSMSAQELVNSLWAYARFAYHPGRIMASFLSVIERRLDEFEGQGCTNCLWSLAVLKATHSTAFVGLLRRCVTLERAGAIPGEMQYNQVLQAVLLAQFEARGGRVAWRPEVDLPEDLVDKALQAWGSQQSVAQLSGFHLDVSEGLKRLGIDHEIEHLVARDLLSIDIAVTKDGRRIAIEVDGPFHFPVNARTPLGHTMIRRRLLRAAGWTTVSIPWYDWFAMTSWTERLAYLAEGLKKADASFAEELRPTTRTLLSAEFSPGPGEVAPERGLPDLGRASAGGSFEEQDGPVLSYFDGERDSETMNSFSAGLISVLARRKVALTQGAVRRLRAMGLSDLLQTARQRQSTAPPPTCYAPPPSSMEDPSGLLPKPARPQPVRIGQRRRGQMIDPWPSHARGFEPRFADSTALPLVHGDPAWGVMPADLQPLDAEKPRGRKGRAASGDAGTAQQEGSSAYPRSPLPPSRVFARAAERARGMSNNAAAADAVISRVMRTEQRPAEPPPASEQPQRPCDGRAAPHQPVDSDPSPP